LRVLSRIAKGKVRALVTDVASLTQRCPLQSTIENRAITLQMGDFISREELSSKLILAGYSQNDPVEDPGSYTTRGNLFDIFSPWLKKPFRLEFFGDELEN